MILETDANANANAVATLDQNARIKIPKGMIGIPDATEFELVASEESLPIMWLRGVGNEHLNFPVVEPGQFVPDYELDLNDADADFLGDLAAPAQPPLVLTVLTVKSLAPQKATINLIGPIVVNRETLVGKQVILANSERYSVEYPVIDESSSS